MEIVSFWKGSVQLFEVGDLVICMWIDPIYPNTVAPPLEYDKGYIVNRIRLDREGNQHLDVGFVMGDEINFVRSTETREILASPNDEWWCHPSRFIKAKIK